MIKIFAYIIKIFEYLPKMLAIFKGLSSLISLLKTEEKQGIKQQVSKDSENRAVSEQEKTNTNVTTEKPMFDEKKLNYLENRSYFLANVGSSKEFDSLPEETKTLSPDFFKKQFPRATKEKGTRTNSETTTEEKPTKIIDENHQRRKNELLNKLTFIANRCGNALDFEKLPDETKTMDPVLFKEKSKTCKF
jgi:flagellin-specific chaperone FliS